MALRITLKPNERIVIGRMLLTNGPRDAEFTLKGEHVPILRESQIMRLEEADTSCKLLYVTVQSVYIGDVDPETGFASFEAQVREIADAAPSLSALLLEISEAMLAEKYYQALRACRRLVAREAELLAAFAASNAAMTAG